ncbi:XkdW family protein [Brevibacillus centrosporus]|uniref:XkdW family protein n=1 Tax=Brevibacillus centrosporus TaxID=54910 RepID=UPI001172A8E7|nr:XkdW family protein [Brevibacillus centrosporus]MEC2131934.1 XkdW family protein [Brevibacillus centrosporus]GED35080.1 hypothetical protein BCE02nite_62210 [Brevibacillus centrosporus]
MNVQFSNERPCSEAQQEREAIELERMSLGALGQELAMEKIKGMQKDALIQALGQEVVMLKLDIIQLKGGGN